MKKERVLTMVAICSAAYFWASSALAAEPKALVEEIFETKETIEKSVRGGMWAEADSAINTLESQLQELVATLQLDDADTQLKQITLIAEGMHKAVADREDEEYEEPAHAMMKQTMELMGKMDYARPPVFVIIARQVEESLELVEDGEFEALEEEMEEIVNLRDEARKTAREKGINEDKVNVILDLAWDISRDADRKNKASATKRLQRMQSILDTL